VVPHIPTTTSATRDSAPTQPFWRVSVNSGRYYTCVISVGQIGSSAGSIISTVSRCAHVLLNEEFTSCWGRSRWADLERWRARRPDAIVVPSDDRHARLIIREELQLNGDKPFVTLRNTPTVTLPAQTDWHRSRGVLDGKKIFINAKTIADWTQVPEILCSVNEIAKSAHRLRKLSLLLLIKFSTAACISDVSDYYWPADAVLLSESRPPDATHSSARSLPTADSRWGHPFARRYPLVAQSRGTAQHDARPQRQYVRRLALPGCRRPQPTIRSCRPDDPFVPPTPNGKSGSPITTRISGPRH
jgi:hypothetical protein